MEMMIYITRRALVAVCLFGLAASIPGDQTTNKVCPIQGPSFPKPSDITTLVVFTDAAKAVDAAIDTALQTGVTAYGDTLSNTSTFSIGVFSASDTVLAYQRHITDPTEANNSVGVRSADADTVYRVRSASKVLTVLSFLSKVGYRKWYEPVTLYLSEELFMPSTQSNFPSGARPKWSEITIGDLAS